MAKLLVVHAAVREPVTVIAAQPVMVVPFEVNATVPVAAGDAGPIVAVKVTA